MLLRTAIVALTLARACSRELATRHAAFNGHHPRLAVGSAPLRAPRAATPGSANCTTLFIEQPIDHFSWAGTPTGALTYQQRYLIYDKYWKNGSAGMIFFYVVSVRSRPRIHTSTRKNAQQPTPNLNSTRNPYHQKRATKRT
jgi:hypothetical protein